MFINYSVVAQPDTTRLRVSIHVFQNSSGFENFSEDSSRHISFLKDIIGKINYRLMNLDTLKPEVPSPYVKSLGIQLILDSIYFHQDDYAWDCSEGIDSDYMRQVYVDQDSSLNYRQKFRTVPIFIGGNYNIVGGHNSLIGDKWYIAMRGLYSEFQNRPYNGALEDCSRNLLHEFGHSLGLTHNFQGGEHGQQCDECEDNGCPEEGTSNNIMDYWPSYGYALSACQKEIVWEYLDGYRGNISEVIINDSCYREDGLIKYVRGGSKLAISDTTYFHSDLVVEKGGTLIVSSYLSIPGECSIIIEPGGELLVENGTLGNLCGDIWEGLVILESDSLSGGKVSFNNAIVEHARTGVTIERHPSLIIDGTFFSNNLNSVSVLGWSGTMEINSCRFEINFKLNHWEEGLMPGSFVYLKDNEDINITDCTFYNSEGHRNYGDLYSGIGVVSENTGLELKSCRFENLFKAVVAGADSLGKFLSIDSCFFAYNHCSVHLDRLKQARITSSNFNLNKLNTLYVYGVYSRKTDYLEVDNNNFYSDFGGEKLTAIVSNLLFPGTHLIHDNEFKLINEGIVTLNNDSVPIWPQALLDFSFENLKTKALGCIWHSNDFVDVKKKIVSVDSEGGGLVKSREGEYDLFSFDWTQKFKCGGFGLYAAGKDECIIRPALPYIERKESGIIFNVLAGKSWNTYDLEEMEREASFEMFLKLGNEYSNGLKFLDRKERTSHEGMVAIASYVRNYPWLVNTSQFGGYLDPNIYEIPPWIWNEIIAAMEKTHWWKSSLHNFIINLAEEKLKGADSEIDGCYSMRDGVFKLMVQKEINVEVSNDIGRLNPGSIIFEKPNTFIIVPNPTTRSNIGVRFIEKVPFEDNAKGLDWIIRDSFGRVITSGLISGVENLIITIDPIPSGSYLLEIWNGNEFLGIQKFIILAD